MLVGTCENQAADTCQNPWTPPGYTQDSLLAKPFHVYDDEFLAILGDSPTFSLVAASAKDPVYHEAIVW